MTGKEKFIAGLVELGILYEDHGGEKISFPYNITDGTFAGKEVRIGIVVPANFDIEPPHGPHVQPRLLPTNSSSSDHKVRVHDSEFGQEWMQLSRPHQHWAKTKRTVEIYYHYAGWLLNTL